MDAGADLQPDRRHRPDDCRRASHRAGGAVEGGQEPVSGRIDLPTTKSGQLFADERMVPFEQVPPGSIADRARVLRRADDVGEHDGGEHAIVVGGRTNPGHELLNLVEDRIRIAEVRQMIDTIELHELCAGNVISQVPCVAGITEEVAPPLQDQRRHLHRRQDRANIDLGVHPEVGQRITRPV